MGWRDEYKLAIARFLLKKGTPVGDESIYGYIATDWEEQCDAVKAALADPAFDAAAVQVEEASWDQFMDTFSGNEYKHGLDAVITIDGREYRFRFEGTLGDAMLGVLDDKED